MINDCPRILFPVLVVLLLFKKVVMENIVSEIANAIGSWVSGIVAHMVALIAILIFD